MSHLILPGFPDLWATVYIGQITKILYGKALRAEDRDEQGNVPVYGSNGVIGRHNEALHPGPSIVIGRKGTVGAVNYAPGPFWCIDTTFYLDEISEFVNIEFLTYILQFIALSRLSIVVGVPGINRADVENERVPLPSLSEQRRIMDILHRADELGQLRRQADELAQDLRAALFSEMFGDPIRQHGGWKERSLSDFVEITSSLVDPTDARFADLLIIGSDNVESDTGKLINLRSIREVGSISGKFLFTDQHVLYSKIRPALRKVATPEFTGLCSADIYPLSVDEGQVTRQFLAQLLRSQHFTAYAARVSVRAQIPKVNRRDLLRYRTLLPDLDAQREFERRMQEIVDIGNLSERVTSQLDDLFHCLFARAFIGELTAAWRDRYAEELAAEARQRDEALGLRARAVRPVELEARPAVLLDETHPRHNVLCELSDVQQQVYQAVLQTEGYFTAENLMPNSDLSPDITRRTLTLLEVLGLVARVGLAATPTSDAVFYVPAQRASQATDDGQGDDLATLKSAHPE